MRKREMLRGRATCRINATKEGASHIAGFNWLTGGKLDHIHHTATNRPASRHDKDSGRENPCQECGPVAHCRENERGARNLWPIYGRGGCRGAAGETYTRGSHDRPRRIVTPRSDVTLRSLVNWVRHAGFTLFGDRCQHVNTLLRRQAFQQPSQV